MQRTRRRLSATRELLPWQDMTVLPNSIRFIERDWLSANHIMLLDEHTATVVDTGYDKHKQLTCTLIEAALQGRKLSRVVNTHLHSDHCGANALLQSKHECEIVIPEASWQDALHWDEEALTFKTTAQACDRFTPTKSIRPGEYWRAGGIQWQAFHSPGHDPKSLIYFAAEERILISADALWANGYGILFPELVGQSGVAEQASILDLIERLDPALVLPGHGPMFVDVGPAIARARSRLTAFGSDRVKHAKNAIKVLVKFLLLDRERIALVELPTLLKDAQIIQDSSRILGLTTIEAVTNAYTDLVSGGQLKLSADSHVLLN
jgi:glyoxylase-like metal-dependent hydrolase (beta-lactamase superfamily II)